jgi:hypothetical protein
MHIRRIGLNFRWARSAISKQNSLLMGADFISNLGFEECKKGAVFPPPGGALTRFHVIVSRSLRHTTIGRTPLDERPARRRDLHLTIHNTHRQTFMPPAGLKPTIPGSDRPQTHALDRAATCIDWCSVCGPKMMCRWLLGFSKWKELLTCCGTVHSGPIFTSKMVAVCFGQKFGDEMWATRIFHRSRIHFAVEYSEIIFTWILKMIQMILDWI